MPTLSVRNDGMRMFQTPRESTRRKGFSRTTGVSAILVYGGLGHSPSGACTMPTNTMFQLEPVQVRHSLLREIHCCCEPESTLPSISESDIHPPLAQPRCWWRTRSPIMCMRRKGTACETAHCMAPPVGVTANPSTPRQKVHVALL